VIDFSTFASVEMRVGTVLEAVAFPEARQPSSAQLTRLHSADELVVAQVIAAINLGGKRIAGFPSEVLVLGIPDEAGSVVLLKPERPVRNGVRVF
jgi:tRNA-binding protein